MQDTSFNSDDLEPQIVTYITDQSLDGKRLDAAIAKLHPDLSRNRLKELILAGAVTLNGEEATEPKKPVKAGDEIALDVPPAEDAEPKPENIPLNILFEDKAVIVIDKPVGMVVHPAPGSPDGTLVNALLFHCGDTLPGIGGVKRPGIVHRLDKDTSGVMIAAKTEKALKNLAAQFADHGRTGPLQRVYTAFVWGRVQAHSGSIDAPLGRSATNRMKQAVRKDGKEAITHYQVEGRFGGEGWDITRIACALETGRTHQIRVHMAHLGHPLLSDHLYAPGFQTKANRLPEAVAQTLANLNRQALHATLLGFEHPKTSDYMEFETELPDDMQALADALSSYDLAKPKRS